METQNVSLTISKEIVQPIVTAKIQEAILSAMGGQDELIKKVVNQVFNQKVNEAGNISTYSSDNKYTWLEVVVTNTLKKATEEAMKEILATKKDVIKAEMIKQLSSKKGLESFAASLIDQTTKISDRYYSKVEVQFHNKA